MRCKICGKEVAKSAYSGGDVLCSTACFMTNYWDERVLEKDKPRSVRINGTQYSIGPEHVSHILKGFGGRRFNIEFFNGRKVSTTNLWHNGEIPDTYREQLPDNARFVTEQGEGVKK